MELSWDGKCILLRVSRNMHGSERNSPGMGHQMRKKRALGKSTPSWHEM
jgi:hypothetical protein